MTSYSEKLKDPRWQRKRLEILERDDFQCQECGGKEDTLHVHHGYYEWGVEPWDYPTNSMRTYCEECHKEIGAALKMAKRCLGELGVDGVRTIWDIANALGLSEAMARSQNSVRD